ncbi:hypothetical protein [Actinopolymorpha rutila]|uniref:Uncharacterized protein n=1 Tax=Actinopolymorpha rutila TaxID=446787 RepID=A0A852ZFE4_9ACTN|nr:hypothetical protein [Actinopolymorpha rutila]NYH90422.1 hypothetical protein [Actinopolymorpha rutila]
MRGALSRRTAALVLLLALVVLTGIGVLIYAHRKVPAVPGRPTTAGAVFSQDLLATTLPNSTASVPVLRLPPLAMLAGDAQYLVAQLGGRSNIVRTPMMGTRIICLGKGGGGGSVWTVQNHLGQAYGVNIERLRWLWRAPNSTSYTCTMYGVATTVVQPDVARLDIDQRTTILTATPVARSSAQWFMSSDSCVGAVPDPGVPECAVARHSSTVLQHTVDTGGATSASVLTDVQLSREYGSYPGGTSTVDVTAQATVLGTDGQPCAPTRSTTARLVITNDLHHLKANVTVTGVPVNQTASCGRSLSVSAVVNHVSGNPVTIEGPSYSNAMVMFNR